MPAAVPLARGGAGAGAGAAGGGALVVWAGAGAETGVGAGAGTGAIGVTKASTICKISWMNGPSFDQSILSFVAAAWSSS